MFLNLFYCSWEVRTAIGLPIPDDGDNLSLYDTRLRNINYISPE